MSTKKRRLTILVLVAMMSAVILGTLGLQGASPYPAGGTGYSGWTGETGFYANPHHVQTAYAGGRLYCAYDNGSDVLIASSADGGLTFPSATTLDYTVANTARDAYIAASGANVVVSWKEYIGSKWALSVAFSTNSGGSWSKYIDSSASWNNYEAHVTYINGGVDAVYTSDYPGWNECYFARWSTAGALLTAPNCISDTGDGVADTQPCLLSNSGTDVWAFYRHENSAKADIYEAFSANGTTWGQEARIYDDTNDYSWPECAKTTTRSVVICQALAPVGNYTNWYTYYVSPAGWQMPGWPIGDSGNLPTYPQITAQGTGWLMVYRDSGSSLQRGVGYKSPSADGMSWNRIENLFYGNMPYNNAGSIDACSDGTRYYAASAGTGGAAVVMVKREDFSNPTAAITDPGQYHNANFIVSATANDNSDWAKDATWFLSPKNQAYQAGIVSGTFGYKLTSSGTWTSVADADAPWSFTFPASTLAEGTYNLQFTCEDTSEKTTTAGYSPEIYVDRTPPYQTTGALSGGVMEAGTDWYRVPPTITADFADALSGVDDTTREYKVNDGTWQAYAAPFVAAEGDNDYYFRAADLCGNMSSSTPTPMNVKVDTLDPTPACSLPPVDGNDGWRRTNAAATVTLSATDNIGGSGTSDLQYAWDGSPSIIYSAPIVAPEGVHTIYFRAKDVAGNWSDILSQEAKKDTTPPTISITSPDSEEWIRGMVTVVTEPEDNCGVGKVEFYLDDSKFDSRTSAPWNGYLDSTQYQNEYHYVVVTVTDLAGNTNTAICRGRIYIANGLSQTNYFAEGTTREGFDTWLCIQNPNPDTAAVTINFQLGPGQGSVAPTSYDLAPHSRTTIPVRNEVGDDKDLSISVTSTKPLISERPMYFEYTGTGDLVDMYGMTLAGNHTAQGTQMPSKEWYFAEGCTRTGFEEWICIQNPGDTDANVNVDYILGTGEVVRKSYTVERWQRYTILVNQEIGYEQDVSVKVTSDQDIVAERPMYFMYQGAWDGGHDVMGVPGPALDWYFAEGCTRPGFNEWLCLQNPGDKDSKVEVKYVTEDVASQVTKDYVIPSHSRYTINVNNDVARDHDVSCYLHCTNGQPIVAERAMYFTYGNVGPGGIDEGSCATGCTNPQSTFYLAEGTTRDGFIEYLCIQNPGDNSAEVSILYMYSDGSTKEQKASVAAHTRTTVNANDFVGSGFDIAVRVSSTQPIILERPMYCWYTNSGGSFGGADTLTGYTFDR